MVDEMLFRRPCDVLAPGDELSVHQTPLRRSAPPRYGVRQSVELLTMKRPEIPSLTGLRFPAATMIVSDHTAGEYFLAQRIWSPARPFVSATALQPALME
jgi:hypothetical protein